MSVASFIASQRTGHGVPHALSCRALGVSESWFYKWHDRPLTPRQQRREKLDQAVARVFAGSDGRYGSPRVYDALVEGGWRVSEKTVAASMARQGLVARHLLLPRQGYEVTALGSVWRLRLCPGRGREQWLARREHGGPVQL